MQIKNLAACLAGIMVTTPTFSHDIHHSKMENPNSSINSSHKNTTIVGDYILAEGDMIVGRVSEGKNSSLGNIEDRLNLSGNLATSSGIKNLWPKGEVYYFFEPSLTNSQKSIFRETVSEYESKVGGLNFIELNTTGGNYIYVREMTTEEISAVPGTAGFSRVGKVGGRQDLALRQWTKAVILHEVGHALGYKHEHTRSDRDNYVTVNLQDMDDCAGFYAKNYEQTTDTPYDVNSIMHYATSKPGTPCMKASGTKNMTKKDGSNIPTSLELSTLDVERMLIDYGYFPQISANYTGCGYRQGNGTVWWEHTPVAAEYILKYRMAPNDQWVILDVLEPDTTSEYQTFRLADYGLMGPGYYVNLLFKDQSGKQSASSTALIAGC